MLWGTGTLCPPLMISIVKENIERTNIYYPNEKPISNERYELTWGHSFPTKGYRLLSKKEIQQCTVHFLASFVVYTETLGSGISIQITTHRKKRGTGDKYE